jgi:hypothetical protein
LQVIGPVTTRLSRRAAGQQFGIFTRLCHVDLRGRSRNGCAVNMQISRDPAALRTLSRRSGQAGRRARLGRPIEDLTMASTDCK